MLTFGISLIGRSAYESNSCQLPVNLNVFSSLLFVNKAKI